MKSSEIIHVQPSYKNRLLKDILRAQEDSLQEQGIWYECDSSNVYKGIALIQGPDNTPYEGCLLLFSFTFPSDYPFSPPKVHFLTSDGYTRFHPNLYKEGKVCLSILGTFSGPTWSGTQSLSSILLSILGILDSNPLSHEPYFEGVSALDERMSSYADLVEHNFIRYMILSIQSYEADPEKHPWFSFSEILETVIPKCKDKIRQKVLQKKKYPDRLWTNVSYGMEGRSFWKKLSETPWIS